MSERLDIAIIGSGPAGLSAALNAKIRKKSFKIFGSKSLSTKVEKAHEINNYLGFHAKTGEEIKTEFLNHIEAMDIEITEEKVNMIYAMGDYYSIMAGDKMYEATSVIIATGVNFGKPLPGEEEFLGKGVSYCATCDAGLYRDKVVTVIGYNRKEEEEVNFLSSVAGKVYYIPMYPEEVKVNEAVEIVKDKPVEIIGEQKVSFLKLKNSEIETDGLFILRESVAPAQLVPGLEMEGQHIAVDRKMKTNLPGLFAAGDIVGTPYQYIKSAGEGNIAALSAVTYIDELRRQNKGEK